MFEADKGMGNDTIIVQLSSILKTITKVWSIHNLCKQIGPRSGPVRPGLIWIQSV